VSSPETLITFTLDQFIILIISIVGAAIGVMGYIYRKTGKIYKNLASLDKKIAILENENVHQKEMADRLRDIEKLIIPAGLTNLSEVKGVIEKALNAAKGDHEKQ
jgi:hypothetical protein